MIFFLNIVVRLDATLNEGIRSNLRTKEYTLARVHTAWGRLFHIWRALSQQVSWSVWEVDSSTELHDLVASLPMFHWMTLSVHALADHPSSEGTSLGQMVEVRA